VLGKIHRNLVSEILEKFENKDKWNQLRDANVVASINLEEPGSFTG
jgi:hypothetical protein